MSKWLNYATNLLDSVDSIAKDQLVNTGTQHMIKMTFIFVQIALAC
jgi:hypothetical protein